MTSRVRGRAVSARVTTPLMHHSLVLRFICRSHLPGKHSFTPRVLLLGQEACRRLGVSGQHLQLRGGEACGLSGCSAGLVGECCYRIVFLYGTDRQPFGLPRVYYVDTKEYAPHVLHIEIWTRGEFNALAIYILPRFPRGNMHPH